MRLGAGGGLQAQAGAWRAWRTSPPCDGSVGCHAGYGADPQVVPSLLYEDAGAAMDWLIRVFGFTERVRDRRSDGTVRHGELLDVRH